MPRTYWKTAPLAIQRRIEIIRSRDGLAEAVNRAIRSGYYWPESELPLPIHERFDQLLKTATTSDAFVYRDEHLTEWQNEIKALDRVRAMAGWAESTSLEDDNAKEAAELAGRRAEERARAVEARAAELMAADSSRKFAKFRETAEKEIAR